MRGGFGFILHECAVNGDEAKMVAILEALQMFVGSCRENLIMESDSYNVVGRVSYSVSPP